MSQVSQEKPCESTTRNSVTGKSRKMIILALSSKIYQIYENKK